MRAVRLAGMEAESGTMSGMDLRADALRMPLYIQLTDFLMKQIRLT